MRCRRAGIVIAVLLAATGAAARLYGAWCYRYGDNPDYGIVALMAKHMAEGRDFPVFFYGQAYMGSFEPAISALICRVAGFSGFAVCLGTALVGILLLPVVYVWARDAGGRIAAAAALAYVLFGPEGYFHYQSSPRGGYAVTLCLGSLIIWVACRMALREGAVRERNGRLAGRLFLLGIMAGLGFWSHMLIVAAIFTAALVLLAGLRRRAFSLPVAAGVPGFLLGSFPFWFWNARHGWQSFDMTSSFGESSLGIEKGLKLFWGPRLLGVLDLHNASIVWRIAVLGLHLGLAVMAVMFMFEGLFRRRRGELGGDPCTGAEHAAGRGHRLQFTAAALVFVLVSSFLFSLSTFAIYNSPRYLLPLIPAFGVLAGCGTAWLWERLARPWRPAAFIPLAVLIGWQMRTLPNHTMREERYAEQRREALELGAFLEEHDIEYICTPYILHGLNYMLEERFTFADIQRERCAWLAETLELAEHTAAMNNCGGLSEFLAATGGGAQFTRFGKLRLHYDVKPPRGGSAEIAAERYESIVTSDGKQVLDVVSDFDRDTAATVAAEPGRSDWLRIAFRELETVAGMRLICREFTYPVCWEVQARLEPGSSWKTLKGSMKSTHFFWSGPRPYWSGRHLRMECRFDPVQVQELRLRMQAHPRLARIELSELHIFAPGGGAMPDSADFQELTSVLNARGIARLHADRWEANRVHVLTGGSVWTSREPEIFEDMQDEAAVEWVRFDPQTALLACNTAVSRTRFCLRRKGIEMRETRVGPWTLFDFDERAWREEYRTVEGIVFTGFSCEIVAPAPGQRH